MLVEVGGEGEIQELQMVFGILVQKGCNMVEFVKELRE